MKLNVKLIIFMWFEFHFGLPIIHLLSMHAWWAIAMYWIQATVTNTHWQHWFNAIQNHFSVKPTMPNNFIRLSGNVKSFHFVAEKSVCLLQCECDFFLYTAIFLYTAYFLFVNVSFCCDPTKCIWHNENYKRNRKMCSSWAISNGRKRWKFLYFQLRSDSVWNIWTSFV